MTGTSNTLKPTNPGPAVVHLGADLSPAVKAIETAYRMIARRHRDVPPATIVVKRDAKAWGHTTVAKVWGPRGGKRADRLEIMISGENLARGAEAVAATLLHEAAHARDLANGILDTDVNGRHNRKFADSAEKLGLTVEQSGWMGWTKTSLTKDQAVAWKAMVAVIAKGLDTSAKAHTAVKVNPATGRPVAVPGASGITPPRRRGDRNLIKASCKCGDSIRASRGVLERCKPTCQECRTAFVEVATSAQSTGAAAAEPR
jgi:hypothetical protein